MCTVRMAPSVPYTRPTQRFSRPPPIQKLGAENHMLQLIIQCSWWWTYVPETCRAKNTSIKLPSCIKVAFHFILWGTCTVKQPSNKWCAWRILFFFLLMLTSTDTDAARLSKGPVQDVNQYTYGQLHIIWTERVPAEIRSPPSSNLIGRSMPAHLSVLLPNSILPPRYSHCSFIPSRKNPARV